MLRIIDKNELMRIYSLYSDFFKFLEKVTPSSEKWVDYYLSYYQPHQEFLESYFSHFPLIDFSTLKQRVGMIKKTDYAWLEDLIKFCPPENIIKEAYLKCKSIVFPKEEPEVYLFIGFFSPDGFIMDFREKPVICFGLERYRDFRLLRILFAHEYAHFLLNLNKGEIPEEKKYKWILISEGICTYFSFLTFPGCRMQDHFLFSQDRLNWCQRNEGYLREIYCSRKFSSPELIDFFIKGNSELDLPPRSGKYLGFQAVKKYLTKTREKNIALLFHDRTSVLSLEL